MASTGSESLVHFLMLVVLVMSHPSSSLAPFGWSILDSCDALPFPFGTNGTALQGFELNCHSGKAYLPLNNERSYQIRDISINTLTILFGSMYYRCYSKTGSEIKVDSSWVLSLEGTPYTVSSSENILLVGGCDVFVKIKNKRNGTLRGCVVFCDSTGNSTEVYSCSGLGCCMAALPYDLKSFTLELENITNANNTDFTSDVNCSVVYIATKPSVRYIAEILFYQGAAAFVSEEKKNNPYIQPLTLEWAVGNETCEKARNQSETYLCKNNSDCYNSNSGYYCNCSQGFQGNPYVLNGCTDIDECADPKMNPCIGRCINEIGNVSCACPRGMVGDGKKDGNGCRRVFPLNLILGLGLGAIFILTTATFWCYVSLQKRELIKMRAKFFRQNGGYLLKQRYDSQGIDSTRKIFTIHQLRKATDNYNENRVLGRGGFGTVYKGILQDKTVVAIKKSKLSDQSRVEYFVNEITSLSQINHKNIVKLLGCCLETEVPLLVYEFVSNGTLFNHIHGPVPLSWKNRLQIATDVAGALAYLHSAASPPIIHRDIKSSNILLDDKFTAKISDFGASRSVPFDQTHVTTVVQGTFGYLDPEYFTTHQLTEKSDVYSFGVVLAELWLREKPISFERPVEIQGLAAYFNRLASRGRLMQVMEPYIVEEAGVEVIEAIRNLTDKCLSLKGEKRPAMREVAAELERLRRATEPELANTNSDALVPLLSGPKIAEQHSHSVVRETEVTRQYSLETSMLSSMELPR